MIDPFETLGLAPRFDVDLGEVERRFRELSRVVHPDRFASAAPGERRRALGRAVDVNEALRVVRDPVRRGEALLRRAGVEVSEASQPRPSAALLGEFLELREELSDARRARDRGKVEALCRRVGALEAEATARLRASLDEVAAGAGAPVGSGAGAGATQAGGAQAALAALGELRYVRRFLDEVAAIEEELGELA